MEIRLNKFGCVIFVLGMACIVRQACQDIKKLNKEMKRMDRRMCYYEACQDGFRCPKEEEN